MTSAFMPTLAVVPEDAARSPQGAVAAPVRLEGSTPRSSSVGRLAALLAALAGHAAVLYWVTHEQPDSMAGGRGLVLDAVKVTMIDSSVFESREDVRARPAPAAADAVAANEGSVQGKPAPQWPEQKEEKAEEKKAPAEPIPAEAVVKAPPKAPDPVKDQEKERKDASTPAAPLGGAAARGDDLSPAKESARAAASPGAVLEYANSVQRVLARAKPKCARGFTTWIKLLVSPSGAIESVEILKSSGNKRSDAIVLAEMQRIKLATPPPGLAFRERWYEFPVRCR
jgi:TonB family protein